MKRMQFTFNEPLGIYTCAELSDALTFRAKRPGPKLDLYGAVKFKSLDGLLGPDSLQTERDRLCLKVLEYQRRWLNERLPGVSLELRAAIATDFGRGHWIVWYAPEVENEFLLEGHPMPELPDPEYIL